MKQHGISGMNRRQFLALAGATAAGAALAREAQADTLPAPPQALAGRTPRPAKIALVFSHVPRGRATWPTKDYDYDARREELTAQLRAACPGTEFTVSTAHNADEAEKIVQENGEADGFLVYLIGIWTGAPNRIMRAGKPTVVVDDLYAGSGEILGIARAIKEESLRAAMISSSDFRDVARGVKWLEVLAALKGARIIDVKDGDLSGATSNLSNILGATLIQMKSDELAQRYAAADDNLAARWADYWMQNAYHVIEPAREELLKSGKIHVAFLNAFQEYEADTLTMDCLGMFYSQKINAYPCLSFFEMLNQGLTGICEADVDSTMTALLMRHLTGRPGFVSDPVIDTSTNEIIYAHCVASCRNFGPQGKVNKYILRSHAEDRQGASVQSLMPEGEPVTTLRLALGDKHLMVHTGVTTRNIQEDKACRTKIAARAEAEKLLRNWTHGWHRVTFYGDWRKDVVNVGRLLGLTVIEEDRYLG